MYQSIRRSTAVPFAEAAAASARGELVEVIGGRRAIVAHLPGRRVSIDVDLTVESPIELHAHGASMIVLPCEMVAEETGLGMPRFVGSVGLVCGGERTFDVVLEGYFGGSGGKLFDFIDRDQFLAAVLDVLVERIEDHVETASPMQGIPF